MRAGPGAPEGRPPELLYAPSDGFQTHAGSGEKRMTITSTLALALAVAIFALTPGPAVIAGMARAITSGFRSAVAMHAGVVLGDVLFLLLAIYGLSAISVALGKFFYLVKLAGGAYLIWLGWRLWTAEPVSLDAASGSASVNGPPTGPSARRRYGRDFSAGLLITLGNPKVILFYAGFLPAFMDLGSLGAADVGVVTAVVVLVLTVVNCSYAWWAARARALFRSRRAARNLNRGAGTVMAGAGVLVATR